MRFSRMPASLLIFLLAATAGADARDDTGGAGTGVVRFVGLGDSITKGVREGVGADETFLALVERALRAEGIEAEGLNFGIGGERTDQALRRLDDVAATKPRIVTVMYGTNDSYVDRGATASRLSLDEYAANLRAIVDGLLLRGIEPVVMTEPRWADGAAPDGLGRNPNERLEPYMEACRRVAEECGVVLIDHFAGWTEAERSGQDLSEWTTDGCHPNPRGHRELADALVPVIARLLQAPRALPFDVRVETVLEHDDGRFLWYHPRATPLPEPADGGDRGVVMTLQKHLHTSDHYSGLSVLRSDDLGRTWDGPDAVAALDWVREPGGVDIAVADVTPMLHPHTGKVIAVGAQVRYSAAGEQLEDAPRSNQTAYAVLDPASGRWTPWKRLEMPEGEQFDFARSACAQFVIEDDGSVLLPFYIARSADEPHRVTVVRCAFDGETLAYREHGDVLALDQARGLYEPSLIRCGGRYFLTIRNDLKGYVTSGDDGLRYRPIKAWTFDDGEELGSYNTQQHWLAHDVGLFLVYTRRGANNDHTMRHRAPLFIAQVDPEMLQVMRATERVLIPERGAELGNFGAAEITDRESWVTVAEGVWDEEARTRGAKGAVFIARVLWGAPDGVPSSP